MSASSKMQEMWQIMKDYFGDGFIAGTAPLRFTVHWCELTRPDPNQVYPNAHATGYGVIIDEDAFPLFSTLGDATKPPCACNQMADVVAHIDRFLNDASDYHENDYIIFTNKGDEDAETVYQYDMRDSLAWWAHWSGRPLTPKDYWKYLYTCFSASVDDIQVPPADLLSGAWRIQGRSWPECRAGLAAEGLAPNTLRYVEMSLWREVMLQYLEKVDEDLRPLFLGRTTLMTQFRTMTANTLGVSACLLATQGLGVTSPGSDCSDAEDCNIDHIFTSAFELSSVAQCLSMDLAKESLGVLEGERTEAVAVAMPGSTSKSPEFFRSRLKSELRWVYARTLEHVARQLDHHLLMRYASSGLHFVPTMDRYLERAHGKRFPMRPAALDIIDRLAAEATPLVSDGSSEGDSETGYLS